MALLCPRCGLASPADASYCYFDGSALHGSTQRGPLDPAQAPFAEPFYFPSGAVCQTFDQFALTCQDRWQETGELLSHGSFHGFLARLGRADLLRAATEAAALADPDHAVDYFIARLPARHLTAPRLHVAPAQLDLGTLRPGEGREFTLRLSNEGHRLIAGQVLADCPWLEVEGTPAGQPRLTQFVQEQTLRVRVVGDRLPAGQKPRTGRLLVATNAGDAQVVVACMVPIVPFPTGALRGCTTPREIALKARQFPQESAELFYRGQVQAWYRSNGWVYPVEGEPASGKAAVQQFFEALGLVKAPHVILDTPAVAFQAPPGKRLQQTIHLHTDDKRPIFAFGRSLSPWLTVVGSVAHGNHASVAIEVHVPTGHAAMLETKLEVRTNGNQRFHVPIVVHIDHTMPVPTSGGAFPALTRAGAGTPAPRRGWGCLLRAVIAVSLLGIFMVAAIAGILVLLMRPDLLRSSPLAPYAAAVAPETCIVALVDLDAMDRTPGFEKEARGLQTGIAGRVADLDLQGEDRRPTGLFVAAAPGAAPLTVWTFASPVKFGKVTPGHFDPAEGKGQRIYVDQLDHASAWAVDGQGRLVGGTTEAVRAALQRQHTGKTSPIYTELARIATRVTPGAPAWAVGDFQSGGDRVLQGRFGEGQPPPRLTQFRLELVSGMPGPFVLRGDGTFPTPTDAAAFRQAIRTLPDGTVPLLPGTLDFNDLVVGKAAWEQGPHETRGEVKLGPSVVQAVLQAAVEKLDAANRHSETALAERAEKQCAPGMRAVKEGDYAGAIKVFEQATAWYPKYAAARAHLQDARQAMAEQKAYADDLQATRDALAADKIAAARTTLDRMKKSRFADAQRTALEKEWTQREQLVRARAALADGRELVRRGDFVKARGSYQTACDLNPKDPAAAAELAAVKTIDDVQAAIQRADQQLKEQKPDAAHRAVMKALDRLLQGAGAGPWREGAFKLQHARLVKSGAEVAHAVYDALKAPADDAQQKAGRLLRMNQFPEADETFKRAQKELDRAKAVLEDLGRLEGKGAFFTAEVRAIEKQTDEIRVAAMTVKGKSLLATGQKKLAAAKASVEEARADPTQVGPTLATLDASLKSLREAEQLQAGIATKPIRAAEDLRRRLGRMLHPVTLDTSGDLKGTDWSFLKDQWAMKAGADGQRRLQAAKGEGMSLQSIGGDWPRDFEVALDFALVDPSGKINNTLWAYYTDPLTVRLQSAAGTSLFRFALGNDEKIKGQRLVRIQLDKSEQGLAKSFPADQPIQLRLRCKKRDTDNRRILTVLLNDREIGALPFPNEVQNLRLQVTNPDRQALGRDWSVAILRLDAAWTGAAKEKAKDP